MLDDAVPMIPLPVAAILLVLSVGLLVAALRIARGQRELQYLLVAVWLRYMASEFPAYTFAGVGGLTIISLVSLAVVGTGILLLGRAVFANATYWAFYAMIAVVLVSGILNHVLDGAFETSLKWLFVLCIATATAVAYGKAGGRRLGWGLCLVVAAPLLFQFGSVALGIAKSGESDGSASFVGGFYHESGMAIVALTFVLVAGLVQTPGRGLKLALIGLGLASLVLANYRTALIAALPILLGTGVAALQRNLHRGHRPLALALSAPVAMAALFVVGLFQERFSDLFVTFSSIGDLIASPDYYSYDQKRLLSARPYIWSQYLTEYFNGNDLELLLGHGPDVWSWYFPLYAHNSVIGALFDIGLVGAVFLVLIWGSMAAAAVRVKDPSLRWFLYGAHIGFVLLNMATMPHWSIEGSILYGLVVGVTLGAARRPVAVRPSRRPRRIVRPTFPPPAGRQPPPLSA